MVPEEKLKEKARMIYDFLRLIYRRLAAMNMVGDNFNIGSNTLREFLIQTMNIVHPKHLKPEDCDMLFVAVNSSDKKQSTFNNDK